MIAVHLKHGGLRHVTSANKLEKGMIVYFKYKTLSGEGRQYVATVLDNNRDSKLHILSMNEIKLQDFRGFAKEFGVVYIRAKIGNFAMIKMNISSKALYEGKVKKQLAAKLNDSYRTLLLKNISAVQVLNYDFGTELNKQLDKS